jgi:TetR/AcrR family transcriptional regulator
MAREREIVAAALEVFSAHGFRGATIDQIAAEAGMSKPNLLYHFRRKEDIYHAVLAHTLDAWLEPLEALDAAGEPLSELRAYLHRKLELSRQNPKASRLFANEILAGAPRIKAVLAGPLKQLVDQKAAVIAGWAAAGRITCTDPHHLIFSIWAVTQHYSDFDPQVRAILGPERGRDPFPEAAAFLDQFFLNALAPR